MPGETFRHGHLIQCGAPRQGFLVEGSPQTCTVVVGISITVKQPSEDGARPTCRRSPTNSQPRATLAAAGVSRSMNPLASHGVAAAWAVIRASVEGPPIDLALLDPNLPDPNLPDGHWLALAIAGSN